MKKYTFLFVILVFFYSLAILLWKTFDVIFYLYNFVIIGTCVGLGIGLWPILPKKKKNIARLISQVTVGGYMFFGLGLGFIYLIFGYIMPENMQIEGFWFWLLGGTFMAAVIHFSIAKIIGPLLFNRAWCGWTCWTAAILDLLPWKESSKRLPKKYGYIRYIHFAVSTASVFILFFGFGYGIDDTVKKLFISEEYQQYNTVSNIFQIQELWWFLGGNIFYFTSGIVLAAVLKDNRAFCKYVCPIVILLKIGSSFSMIKVKKVTDNCTDCKSCEKKCPMDIKITQYLKEKKRVSSSECILCHSCISSCPHDVLKLSFGLDKGKEYLNYKNESSNNIQTS